MDTYRNFINGEWVESVSSKSVNNINPANTDDIIGTVKQATRDEAKRAVESAAENFPGWRYAGAVAWKNRGAGGSTVGGTQGRVGTNSDSRRGQDNS